MKEMFFTTWPLVILYMANSLCSKYPHAGALHHIWVAKTWATDIGLPQLADTLLMNLVDGRVLNSLTKEDLRKYLKINRKIEQVNRDLKTYIHNIYE